MEVKEGLFYFTHLLSGPRCGLAALLQYFESRRETGHVPNIAKTSLTTSGGHLPRPPLGNGIQRSEDHKQVG